MQRWLPVVAAMLVSGPAAAADPPRVGVVRVTGPIGPATAGYIERAIRRAAPESLALLVIELDTPGGLLESTKDIVQSLYSSPVPTVVYVSPTGATATSAGCFITLAADVAAMAPHTTIGAAHPVVGGGGAPQVDETMKQKLENFATSYIETIADKRRRNVEWAREAVRASASITAEKALELKVIDLIASDAADLLRQLDGRTINGRVLATSPAEFVAIPMSTRERIFHAIWRPEVLFILMLVAIYGIIGELSNPGSILPGVIGVVALILVLYLGAGLPINVAGVVLIVLALGLFIADIFAPTHGALTAGGVVSFFIGSLMLVEAEPGFRIPWTLALPGTLVTAAFFAFVIAAGLRAQYLPVRTGASTMVGRIAPALTRIDADGGQMFVEGEYWAARSDVPIESGEPAEVVRIRGLTLDVKPAVPAPTPPQER
jgi:membrane-bound serine protease (ClpP class)